MFAHVVRLSSFFLGLFLLLLSLFSRFFSYFRNSFPSYGFFEFHSLIDFGSFFFNWLFDFFHNYLLHFGWFLDLRFRLDFHDLNLRFWVSFLLHFLRFFRLLLNFFDRFIAEQRVISFLLLFLLLDLPLNVDPDVLLAIVDSNHDFKILIRHHSDVIALIIDEGKAD